MSNYLVSTKDTIKEHPVETALVVGAVGILAILIYSSRKPKRVAPPVRPVRRKPISTRWSRFVDRLLGRQYAP